MPAQYALVYYLGSTILGSFILSFLVLLGVNIPNGTLYFDGLGMVVLLSCLIAMIGSLPFHAWLNWVWYKRVATQPYEDFSNHFFVNIGWGVRFIYYWFTCFMSPILSLKLDRTAAVLENC